MSGIQRRKSWYQKAEVGVKVELIVYSNLIRQLSRVRLDKIAYNFLSDLRYTGDSPYVRTLSERSEFKK